MVERAREPRDAVIAVTHRCNAQCVMCNVWKSTAVDTLLPEHLDKLPPSLRTVNLTGGEPFLRDDLVDFVRQVRRRCPRATLTISTNAFLPDRIAAAINEVLTVDPTCRLAISLDGVGSAHDRARGLDGAYDKAIDLIKLLRAEGYEGLRLSMTLTRDNLDQLVEVAGLADQLGLELGVVAAHPSEVHLNVRHVESAPMPRWVKRAFEQVVSRWLRRWRVKHWLRAHFTAWTYLHLAGRPWVDRCRAGEDFFFVQADGTVYSCNVHGEAMGNLTSQSWADIWSGQAGDDARRKAATCPERCWMICTVRSIYRAHPARILTWAIVHKLLAHLRLLRLPAPEHQPPERDD